MKPTLLPRIPGEKLPHAVPPAYREAVRKAVRPDGQYSLLLFDHAPRDVVPSAPVRKALRRLGAPAPDGIVAVGTVFTQEALGLLKEAGARFVALRQSRWTDESARQRQLQPGGIGPAPQGAAASGTPAQAAGEETETAACAAEADAVEADAAEADAVEADAVEADAADTDAAEADATAARQDGAPPEVPARARAAAVEDADGHLAGYAGMDYVVAGLEVPLHPGEPNAGLAALLDARGAKCVAVFTACSLPGEAVSAEEHARRRDALRAALEQAGLCCTEAEARPRGGGAQPLGALLAVFDAPPSLLQRLMEEHGQNAVLLASADGAPRLWLLPRFMRELAREEYEAG